ncbi:UNVERIFIED_CONTAM: hypothetical protein Scaly_1010000 [Sesamum calycinum]|uniref:Uncharacterized protein n=1 Tax=Sesamum calycinum TaxID=2727403 RepID=A0AAW2QJ15_9LAMI
MTSRHPQLQQLRQQQLAAISSLHAQANSNAFRPMTSLQIPQVQSPNMTMARAPPVKVEGFQELMGGDSSMKHDSEENKLLSPQKVVYHKMLISRVSSNVNYIVDSKLKFTYTPLFSWHDAHHLPPMAWPDAKSQADVFLWWNQSGFLGDPTLSNEYGVSDEPLVALVLLDLQPSNISRIHAPI